MTRKIVSYRLVGNMIRYVDSEGDSYAFLANKFSSVAEVEAAVNRAAKKVLPPKKKDLLVSDLIGKSVTEIKAIEVVVPEVPKDA